jgi:hypothetical protein
MIVAHGSGIDYQIFILFWFLFENLMLKIPRYRAENETAKRA